MNHPLHVQITEVGTRDGFQAERAFIPTARKIEFIDRLIDAGVPRLEATSFVSPRAVPQLADAEEVMRGVDRTRGAVLAALVPNKRGALRAAEAGVDEMVVFVSASESHNRKNVNREIEESLVDFEDVARVAGNAGIPVSGAISVAFGCPFEGDVAAARVGEIARRFRQLGFVGASLGDTTGMATPPLVAAAVAAVREAAPGLGLGLHFHNTRGIGLANVMAGLELGVDKYESSFGGIGGCPFAAEGDRQHLHRGPGLPARRDGHRHRHRPAQPLGHRVRCRSRGGPRAAGTDHEGRAAARSPLDGFGAGGGGLTARTFPVFGRSGRIAAEKYFQVNWSVVVESAPTTPARRFQQIGFDRSLSSRSRSSRSSILSCSGSRGRRPAARPRRFRGKDFRPPFALAPAHVSLEFVVVNQHWACLLLDLAESLRFFGDAARALPNITPIDSVRVQTRKPPGPATRLRRCSNGPTREGDR